MVQAMGGRGERVTKAQSLTGESRGEQKIQ